MRIIRTPTCHPDRKHYGRGLCYPCYATALRNGELHKHERTERLPQKHAECHPDRPHRAYGLCDSCVQLKWRRENPDAYRRYQERYRSKPENIEKMRAYRERRYREKRTTILAKARAKLCAMTSDERRDRKLRQRHGISLDDYRLLRKRQHGRCALCSDSPKKLYVDHCHRTMRIRGLLCQQCNTLLGWYERKAPRIQLYLQAPPAAHWLRERA